MVPRNLTVGILDMFISVHVFSDLRQYKSIFRQFGCVSWIEFIPVDRAEISNIFIPVTEPARLLDSYEEAQYVRNPHLSISYRFDLLVLKTLLYPQCACSNELDACAFQYVSPRNWSHMVSSVRHFWILMVEWSGAWSCLFWWRHRFQMASFSPSTLENSVFKMHRFQIAPPWRAL